MPGPKEHERPPSKAEFARELEVAFRDAGYDGTLTREGPAGVISIEGGPSVNLDDLYGDLAGLDAARRNATLLRAARVLLHPPQLPELWHDAEGALLPALKTRTELFADDLRRQAGRGPAETHVIDLTQHLVCVLVYPVDGGFLSVPAETLARWGVTAREAFRASSDNLGRRSQAAWFPARDAPGVFVCRWHDGLAGSRLFVPAVFDGIRLHGRPVVMVPTPNLMLAAGSEDEDGLFHLGLLGRRILEAERRFFTLHTLRLAPDEETWEDWSPPRGHGAYEALRLLRALEDVWRYDEHAKALSELWRFRNEKPLALPRLELFQSTVGAEAFTTTTWRAGPRAALPKADAVVFRQGGETLGIAPWAQVERVFGGTLVTTLGYPSRYVADHFPDRWQLELLDLKPWRTARRRDRS